MQKKYPFIKIDNLQNKNDTEKDVLKKSELENVKTKPYNI